MAGLRAVERRGGGEDRRDPGRGRPLFDVLTMARVALSRVSGAQAVATVHRVPRGIPYDEDTADDIPLVYLLVTVEQDDDGDPCITISQLNED
ncbi:hypothetical protein [Actinomadura madurae]|uniref:hypothetical protein n=1 Tax=Actinomadura madurae TaxID=1993 RepID=UPI0020D2376D|nr:hypothetical protein [Actinomadura madurae]MCQ0012781.1 hypothetical protein [Actinomadura madurae]